MGPWVGPPLGWALSRPCPPVFHPPVCSDLAYPEHLPSASPAPLCALLASHSALHVPPPKGIAFLLPTQLSFTVRGCTTSLLPSPASAGSTPPPWCPGLGLFASAFVYLSPRSSPAPIPIALSLAPALSLSTWGDSSAVSTPPVGSMAWGWAQTACRGLI